MLSKFFHKAAEISEKLEPKALKAFGKAKQLSKKVADEALKHGSVAMEKTAHRLAELRVRMNNPKIEETKEEPASKQ